MADRTLVEFDLDRYLRNSKKVDLSGIEWDDVAKAVFPSGVTRSDVAGKIPGMPNRAKASGWRGQCNIGCRNSADKTCQSRASGLSKCW